MMTQVIGPTIDTHARQSSQESVTIAGFRFSIRIWGTVLHKALLSTLGISFHITPEKRTIFNRKERIHRFSGNDMRRLVYLFALPCLVATATGCRGPVLDDEPSADNGPEMIELLTVRKNEQGLTFARFQFKNKSERAFEYFGDSPNSPRTQVEAEGPDGRKLCGNTGGKPDYYRLAPGETVHFSVRWEVYSKHKVKRLGIRIYIDESDRKRNEVVRSAAIE
jgi:hypothetical protein